MKLVKKLLKAILVIVIFITVLILIINKEKNNDRYNVIKWENYYNEEKLEIFYTKSDKRLDILNSTYKVNEFLNGKDNEIDKVLMVVDIVNSVVEFDDVEDSKYFNGYDILSKKVDGKKVSAKDMAIITRDFLTSAGYISRVGEFKNEKGWFKKDKAYYVVEYWSLQYNKWIMIDFIDRGYFKYSEVPYSAIEVSFAKKNQLEYVGKKSKNDYLSDKKQVYDTYTIMIDNTLDMEKSNSVLTVVKSSEGIYLEHKNKYLRPTIFTEEVKIVERDPNIISSEKDTGTYIILMKKDGDNNFFIIGAFSSGSIINEYFVRKDNGDFIKVRKYDEIELTPGSHSIEISLDGESTLSKIGIDAKKN